MVKYVDQCIYKHYLKKYLHIHLYFMLIFKELYVDLLNNYLAVLVIRLLASPKVDKPHGVSIKIALKDPAVVSI